MHTDSGMTGISLSGYMPYMTVASLEMSDEPKIWGDFQLLEWCWLTCGMVLADLRNGTF